MVPQTAAVVLLLAGGAGADVREPVRMSVAAFGTTAEVEVRDLPRPAAEGAIRAALYEIYEISRLVDPDGEMAGGVGALNRAAGRGEQTVDPRVEELLVRSLQFCIWSSGALGPLGGALNRLWAERENTRRPPHYEALRTAVGSAECNRLRLVVSGPDRKFELTVGSRVDLSAIARGFAVDRAVEILRQHGAANAWAEIGNVRRAVGDGPDGEGWLVTLPPPAPGMSEPIDQLWLRDQALVVVSIEPVGKEPFIPLLDQRTGTPARSVVTVVAVTELAVDAQPLAATLFILGHREGQLRLGTLEPRPSVYWLLGGGQGPPLEASYRWSELRRVRRR